MFIFTACLASLAAVTPVKYVRDIIQVTICSIILKILENNGLEKIGLVAPIPCPASAKFRFFVWFQLEQVVKETVDLPAFWDAVILNWRHFSNFMKWYGWYQPSNKF